MKKIKIIFAVLALACTLGYSCTSEVKFEQGEAYPVGSLLTPVTNYFLELRSGASALQQFSWSPATVSDGCVPTYELVFYASATGGTELGRLNMGASTNAQVSHKDINRIAGLANVGAGETGSIYWSVIASRGISEAVSTQTPNKLTVKRLLGFNAIPEKIYIMGDASEAGSDLSDAIQFRTIGDGEYEIFTELKGTGKYTIVDGTTGTPKSFSASGGILSESAAGSDTPGAGVYQIVADFNTRAITLKKVTKVEHWFAPTSVATAMTYAGRGVWTLDYTVGLKEESWGKDERYSFRATISGNAWPWECWGSSKADNSRPASLTGDYFKIVPRTNISMANQSYDYTYKYMLELDATPVTLKVDMSANGEYYHHVIETK